MVKAVSKDVVLVASPLRLAFAALIASKADLTSFADGFAWSKTACPALIALLYVVWASLVPL